MAAIRLPLLAPWSKAALAAVFAVSILSSTTDLSHAQRGTNPDVIAFVTAVHDHGVPYDEARALGPSAIPTLRKFLEMNEFKPYWTNVAMTIGYIGRPNAFRILHDFVWRRFDGNIDVATLQSLIAAQTAMGYTVPSGPSGELRYLTDGADPSFWNGLPWAFESYTDDRLGLLMSKITINALSLTGAQSASDALSHLRNAPYAQSQIPNIEEGIDRIERIRSVGIAEYHRQNSPYK